MWFGTVDGLNRYNGYHIQQYNTDIRNPNSLTNNTIRSLTEDTRGQIWIGTNDGLDLYDPQSDQIYQIVSSQGKLQVWALYIEQDQLLIGTSTGLFSATIPEKITIDRYLNLTPVDLNTSPGRQQPFVRHICPSRQGGFWVVSTSQINKVILDNQSKEIVVEEKHRNALSNLNAINCMIEDQTGNLWIVSRVEGLQIYNPSRQTMRRFSEYGSKYAPNSEKCSSIAMDLKGNIWIGSLDNGLSRVKAEDTNKKKITFEHIQHKPYLPNGLNSNLIYSLYITDANQLWIGTIGSGINIYDANQKPFQHYYVNENNASLNNSNFVRSVLIDGYDNILIGTHANGLVQFNKRQNDFKKLGFGENSVFHILKYRDNQFFICSNIGSYIIQIDDDQISSIEKISDDTSFFITKGKGENYYLATLNGITHIRIHETGVELVDKFSTRSTPRLSSNICRVIHYDDFRHKLFVGTEGGGVNLLDLDADNYIIGCRIFMHRKGENDNSISNNYIRSIVSDAQHNIWIGSCEGLNRLAINQKNNNYQFQTFTIQEGLPNNMIQSIIYDYGNTLWIGTNNGLSRFNLTTEEFVNFYTSDGIQSNEFSEHAVCKRESGEILFGGINGITEFMPHDIKPSTIQPKTTITALFVFGEKMHVGTPDSPLTHNIALTDSLILDSKSTNIAFEFSALLFPCSEKIKYAYKLDGFDKQWNITLADNRIASYTNLHYGDYTFMVKSTNTDGIWEETPRLLRLHIKTPFYLTRTAYGIYILLLLGTLYYGMRLYLTRKKMLIFAEMEQMRARFFINISHDLRTPLTLIREPLGALLKEKSLAPDIRDRLQLIMRNVKRLNYLFEQLLDTRKAEVQGLKPNLNREDIVDFIKEEIPHFSYALNQKNLTLKLEAYPEHIVIYFDRDMISRVLFNIMSNALKYTSVGGITIKISRQIGRDNTVSTKVEISDTGIGMSKEVAAKAFVRFYRGDGPNSKGYGIGLSHTKELIEAHKGQISIQSQEGVGTTLTFTIPDLGPLSAAAGTREGSSEDLYIEQEGEEPEEVIRPQHKTILIVDDNADMRNFIKQELRQLYNIVTARDGVEGYDKAQACHPDLIISDIMMPNLDGMGFYRRIKSDPALSRSIFIFLTAKEDVNAKYEGIGIGAEEYLTKPFDMKYLKIRVDNLLSARERLRRLYERKSEFVMPEIELSSADDRFLKKLFELINNHISDPDFSISSLESALSMSHTSFYSKIKSLTGQSAQELLFSIRMKLARQLLQENKGLRVSEVAYMVGFSNPKYFSKRFKEMYGISPKEAVGQEDD